MARRIHWPGAVGLLIFTALLAPHVAAVGEDDTQPADEAEIRKVGTDYVAAFNRHDAKALAEYWSAEAVYTNRLTGEKVTGRDALASQFADMFQKNAECKMTVAVESIEFLSPNVAIEKGVATIVFEAPEEIPYSAVYVKNGGNWLLDRVTDDPQPVTTSHYEQLKPLAWMVGTWIDQDESGSVKTVCNWTKNQNYLTRAFTISGPNRVEVSGLQIIGWDAGEKRIRSWTFDSDGGFAQAHWTQEGDQWYAIKKGTTADGKTVSAVNVMTCVDNDTFELQSVQRSVDGQLLPNSAAVLVVRQ